MVAKPMPTLINNWKAVKHGMAKEMKNVVTASKASKLPEAKNHGEAVAEVLKVLPKLFDKFDKGLNPAMVASEKAKPADKHKAMVKVHQIAVGYLKELEQWATKHDLSRRAVTPMKTVLEEIVESTPKA